MLLFRASRILCLSGLIFGGFFSPAIRLSAQTAEELLNDGSAAFSAQDYARAESRFARFVQDYGRSSEAASSMEGVVRLLVVSLLKQQKFEPAVELLDRYLKDYPSGSKVEDFSFWSGLARLRSGHPAEADISFDRFLQKYPQSSRVQEVQFSRGLCLLQQSKFKEVAAYYQFFLAQLKPEQAYQARIIRLYALMEGGYLDEAALSLVDINPQSEAAGKIAAFHLLALDLGNKLLEKEDYAKALVVLQRVWSKTRILARQKGRLEEIKARMAKIASSHAPDESYEMVYLRDLVPQIESEMQQLEKMEDYDSALQFRIGQCFIRLDRPREAYLGMREMVAQLPDSALLASARHTLMICLMRMERWDEALVAASDFEKRFPGNKEMPEVLYLKAEALRRIPSHEESRNVYLEVAGKFPQHPLAPRCLFLAGYALLMQDRNQEACLYFETLLKDNPRSPFAEQILYWQAMSLHFGKEYEKSREAFAVYLKDYPKGSQVEDATFRRAQALFNQKLFAEAYKELEFFLQKFPEAAAYDEACNLLGDCYLALGEVDRGLASYKKLSGKNKKLSDYAVFRIGQVYKALEDYEGMREHFQKFIQERPDSPRLAEGLAQLAWFFRHQEQPGKARNLYWEAIQRYGNDPEVPVVEDMLKSLAGMYRQPDEKNELKARLANLGAEAVKSGKASLAARTLWMRSRLVEKEDPALAVKLRLDIPGIAQTRELSAVILADVGDELRRSRQWDKAADFYKTLLSWYPSSVLKDRAYAGLGLIAREQGRNKEALEWFVRFEKESSQSPLLAEVLQNRAGMYLERNQYEEAAGELERLLQVPSAKGKPWVEALYQIGEIKLKQKDAKRAIPYFQRIYVMYGRWSDYVAKAYWESGQAFEQLEMKSEAANTYKEFLGKEHLQSTPEYKKAMERLGQMGGV